MAHKQVTLNLLERIENNTYKNQEGSTSEEACELVLDTHLDCEGGKNRDDSKADDAQKPSEEGMTAPTVTVPDMPVIGMDGKTADGSMPYEILKQQLAFLR